MRKRIPFENRFWAKVVKAAGCWLWTGSTNWFGYGQIQRGGRGGGLIQAHRASWEIGNGPIPDGMLVLHTCDVPNCVNPSHLFLGTQKDNVADMIVKGRLNHGDRRGEKNPFTKLTAVDVKWIRLQYAHGVTQTALGKKFNVTQTTISNIVNRITWGHIE